MRPASLVLEALRVNCVRGGCQIEFTQIDITQTDITQLDITQIDITRIDCAKSQSSRQKGNLRPIDNYKGSLLTILRLWCTVDVRVQTKGRRVELISKCWDLSGAYKQLALSDDVFSLDSFLAVWNPDIQSGSIFDKVLPFGSVASVTAFLRMLLGNMDDRMWNFEAVLDVFRRLLAFGDSQPPRLSGTRSRQPTLMQGPEN